MRVINISGNTLYAEDIDTHFPFQNKKTETLDTEMLKRSKCLRSFIVSGLFEIVDYDQQEQIEISISYLSKKYKANSPAKTIAAELPEAEADPEPINQNIEVKIHGVFYDASGYAKVNRNFAMALHDMGYQVKIDPRRTLNQMKEGELKPIVALEKTKLSKNYIQIDSVIPTFAETYNAKYKVLYSTIESYSVPKQFTDCCELYDEIWLTSPFSVEVLKKYTNKPVYCVPAGVDEDLYTEYGEAFDLSGSTKDFVFLSVFGWGYRKGYDVLLRAYFDEFSDKDNVSLLIMSRYQSGNNRSQKEKIKTDIDKIQQEFHGKKLPHVVRLGKVLSEEDMPKLYRACNSFVLLSRGEGSALPPVEASLCGLPVIMTNVSGQQMYLRPDNAFLVEMDELQKAQSGLFGIHYWDGQEFPVLKSKSVHEDSKRMMRTVYQNYQSAKQVNQNLQHLILNNFTWRHTARAASLRLEAIAKKLNGE